MSQSSSMQDSRIPAGGSLIYSTPATTECISAPAEPSTSSITNNNQPIVNFHARNNSLDTSVNISIAASIELVMNVSQLLPKFDSNTDDVSAWWTMCEEFFMYNGICDPDIQFRALLQSFGKEDWHALSPFLLGAVSSQQRYAQLKLGIFQLFSLNDIQRENKMRAKQYGKNDLPSSIYNDIKIGLGELGQDENLVMRIFKTKLSTLLKQMLTPYEHLNKFDYLAVANKIFKNGIEIDAVDENVKSDSASTNHLLLRTISDLQDKVKDLSFRLVDEKLKRGPPICFPHQKFGYNCFPNKCRPPCSWYAQQLPM